MAVRKKLAQDRVPPMEAEPPLHVLVGVVADHWCMHFRDTGEHDYHANHRDQLVCKGCGAKPGRGKKK
ncbi:hypothetical protein SEA_ERENYEAGER_24 [Microbacterium phage Erenyeager]|nr:hypothetical protein SEA_ERENYEAGER_24 [Microbacterium phage Erenyeager]